MSNDVYRPSATAWVQNQVDQIDATGDTRSVDIMGRPIVVLTVRGAVSGQLRKVPLMRVEHEGVYAAVASAGGAPQHPAWYRSISAHPEVSVHDGTSHIPCQAREIEGAEREEWWDRCIQAFPPYAEYAEKTAQVGRIIPVLLCEPAKRS